MSKIKLFDVFSGIGGFHLALKEIVGEKKLELVGFSEKDKYAIKTYLYNYPESNKKNFGDITKIDIRNIPNFDILAGGPPCQSFSVAGKGKGFDDIRGQLVFKYLEILKIKKPKYFIFENVKGILFDKHKKGLDLFIKEINELGYNIQYKLLNSSDYGVFQERKRFFIVGKHKSFGELNFSFKNIKIDKNKTPFSHFLEKEVDEKYFYGKKHQDFMNAIVNIKSRFNQRTDFCFHQDSDLINARTLTANLSRGIPVNVYINKESCKNGFWTCAFVDDKDVCRGCEGGDNYQETYTRTSGLRKLTPIECERIQGYKDNYTNSGISDSQRYKQIGNSVSPKLIKLLIKELLNDNE